MLLTLQPTAFMSRLLGRDDRALATPRVTRWLALGVPGGATRELPRAKGRMTVHCRTGSAWITHDGDPRDIVLQPNQSYTVDRTERTTVYAMQGHCALELQEET
jgi:Protein of unknown function (DUF2917)